MVHPETNTATRVSVSAWGRRLWLRDASQENTCVDSCDPAPSSAVDLAAVLSVNVAVDTPESTLNFVQSCFSSVLVRERFTSQARVTSSIWTAADKCRASCRGGGVYERERESGHNSSFHRKTFLFVAFGHISVHIRDEKLINKKSQCFINNSGLLMREGLYVFLFHQRRLASFSLVFAVQSFLFCVYKCRIKRDSLTNHMSESA